MLFDRTAPRSGELFAPLPAAALALLVANDVWWKAAFHNELTGKLSDVAVCFVMPLFLSELLGLSLAVAPRVRLAAGAAFTAVLFTLLELVPWCTQRALAALTWLGPYVGLPGGYCMTSDPTDLLCVPLVLLAYGYGLRRLGAPAAAPPVMLDDDRRGRSTTTSSSFLATYGYSAARTDCATARCRTRSITEPLGRRVITG
jgi:hypothetical protein